MQTFLPYPDFDQSAGVLDNVRLGKQRVEVLQVVRALTRPVYGWKNHPAVLMWRGHEEALGAYGIAVCGEWRRRGFADTCERKILDDLAAAGVPTPPRDQATLERDGAVPLWLGDDRVHRSHRSALIRKKPEWYGVRFPDDPADLPYTWPVRKNPDAAS